MALKHQQQQQWLVTFGNKTHVLDLPPTTVQRSASSPPSRSYPSDSDSDDGEQHDYCCPYDDDESLLLLEKQKAFILEEISFRTGWPASYLQVVITDDDNNLIINNNNHWCSVRTISGIRGGKGGFGTLLRSSARQSGAKLTTDFGACRDLQGRRLRHVNDEIKLRKWREEQERKKNGQQQEGDNSMFDTPSGLYNWHLMVPSWADISKKSTRKIQRQFKRMQQEKDDIEKQKQEQKAQYERSVAIYVNRTTQASNQIKLNVKSAVQQGLQARAKQKMAKAAKASKANAAAEAVTAAAEVAKKRKREDDDDEEEVDVGATSSTSTSLCTLSGDVVVEEKKKESSSSSSSCVFQIQSHADFSTLALFLDKKPPPPPPPSDSSDSSNSSIVLYYEIKLVTGGLAQIGWADMTSEQFKPNTDEGDGVGDLVGSYGYDGSRGLKFYNGKEETINKNNSNNNTKWKAGDVVGCCYNIQSGEISYTLNGKELEGIEFHVDHNNNNNDIRPAAPAPVETAPTEGTSKDAATTTNNNIVMFPALSCNGGEILELHVDAKDMEFMPNNDNDGSSSVQYVAVKELITASIIDTDGTTGSTANQKQSPSTNKQGQEDADAKKPAAAASTKRNDDDNNSSDRKSEPTKDPSAAAAAAAVATSSPEKEPVKVEALDLNQFQSSTDLEELGLDRLKGALMAIGVKCGGSLKERAARLFSLKGLERKDYPKKVVAKKA